MEFILGQLVVKGNPGKFKAVAADDENLEQTINTRREGRNHRKHKEKTVAEGEMIYIEMIVVDSLYIFI